MRSLLTAMALVLLLAGSAEARKARRDPPAPSPIAAIAAHLESGLDAVGGFEERCRAAGAWLLEGRSWLEELAAWQVRSGLVSGWFTAAAAGADALLAAIDPAGRLPRIELEPYKMMQVQPVAGGTSSGFGYRDHPVLGRRLLHKGIDFRADTGTPVYAAAPGMVVRAAPWDTYGNIIILDHGMGVTTRYAHLSKIRVREGDFVAAGARIGDVGATGRVTGAHLHFEVRFHGEAIDPRQAFVEPQQVAQAGRPDGFGELVALWIH